MNDTIVSNIAKYAKKFKDGNLIQSGYVAVRDGDGIAITTRGADFSDIKTEDVVFVNDKNIESYDGNFRAAAVILYCVIRQSKVAEAAVIMDSDAVLEFSAKRKTLCAVTLEAAQLLGLTVKCASKNVAAEIVAGLGECRNASFMPDAGAVVRGRSLEETFEAARTLDRCVKINDLADGLGGAKGLNAAVALFEQIIYRSKTSKANEKAAENEQTAKSETVQLPTEGNAQSDVEGSVANAGNAEQPEQSADNARSEQPDVEQSTADEANSEQSENSEGNDNSDNFEDAACKVRIESGAVSQDIRVCAYAAAHKNLPVPEEYKDVLGGEVVCVPFKKIKSVNDIEKSLKKTDGAKVAIVANVGAVALFESAEKSEEILSKVEAIAKETFEK